MSILLEMRGLQVLRGGRAVLDIDQLQVFERQTLAVIGPNGAGKSTLLLTLARLLRPSQGQITWRGQPVERLSELAYRRRIGIVLQDPLLLDTSVFNNVAAGLRFRGLPRSEVQRRVDEWLKHLGIAHLRDRPARRLSGGEAQRASLARALVVQPELLLLDEPFSALDAPTRIRLLEDIHALLAETHVTTVFITHDLEEALYLGDHVAVLLGGRLRQSGVPHQVFSAPADPEVAAFVGVETVIEGQVVESNQGLLRVRSGDLIVDAVGDLPPGRSVLLCLRPEDITIWPEAGSAANPGGSSARNRLQGRILRLVPRGPLTRVVVDCGFPLVALITRPSALEMGLAPGQMVAASFKASAIHLIPR